jgi:hypothetical protein
MPSRHSSSYNRFLPGIPTAPGSNRNMVNDPDRVDVRKIRVGDGSRVAATEAEVTNALRDLHQKSLLAAAIKAAGMDKHANMQLPSDLRNWRELRESTGVWLARHIGHMQIAEHSSADQANEQLHTLRAADEGSATAVAFQEVLPHILAGHEFEDPNAEIADWARHSKGFIIGWLGVDASVDGPLAYALADEKPITRDQLYQDLYFDPDLFISVDDVKEVRLDPAKVADLRSRNEQRSPLSYQDPSRALFGCPASDFIAPMYDAQVNAAQASGLFGQTYQDARSIR